MLERVQTCFEPASQAFLHRFEAPYRSQRLLSPDFFRYGLQPNEPAPWWPSFLASVRSVPQAAQVPPTQPVPNIVTSRKHSLGRRHKDRCSSRVALESVARAYSRTAATRHQDGNDVAPRRNSPQEDPSIGRSVRAQKPVELPGFHLFAAAEDVDDGTGVGSDGLGSEPEDTAPHELMSKAEEASQQDLRHLTPAQARIEQLLQFEDSVVYDSGKSPTQELWELFIALPDQSLYASSVMRFLAASSEVEDLNHALSAFATIPGEERTDSDYDVAVDAASRRKRFPHVLQLCKEATSHQQGDICRQTALLALLRAGLYKSAVRLWNDCWGDAALIRYDWKRGRKTVPMKSLQVVDNCDDLLDLFTKTCRRISRADALLTKADRQSLHRISCGLAWRIFDSRKTMGSITFEELNAMFDHLESVKELTGTHMLHAVRTLCSSRTMKARYDLACTLYRNFRWRFPDTAVPRYILRGLLYLCYKAGETPESVEFFLGEFKERKVDWSPDPYRPCPGKDEYILGMRTLAWQGNTQGVSDLYSRFIVDHGKPKTIAEVIPWLYVHAVLGDVAATRKAFEYMQSEWSFAPNTICWNMLMYAHTRSAEPHICFDVFDEMLRKKISPDFATYGLLSGVCADVGDESTLLSLLDLATKQNIKNIRTLLSDLIEVYLLSGDDQKAEDILQNLDKYNIDSSPVRMWNILLRHHAYESHPSEVVRVQEKMMQAGVEPDEMTYGTMMAALIQKGRTREALRILRRLHLDGTITATPFLYSLLMHGFQKEKNRDMVNTIWTEMQERFPTPSPSAKLAKLRSEKERGFAKTQQRILRTREQARLETKEALRFLEQNGKYLAIERATKEPQPGFQRRKPHEAVPSIYTEVVAEDLAMYGKPIQAGNLLEKYDQAGLPHPDHGRTVRNLTTRLLVAAKNFNRDEVDDLWTQIVELGVKTGLSPLDLRRFSPSLKTKPKDVVAYMEGLRNKMADGNVSILPARHLSLGLPLSRYMIALGDHGRCSILGTVVEKFVQLGFTLTGLNWNTYVKTLCNSTNPEHHLEAFDIFERVLLPNMPPMRILERGLLSEPHSKGTSFDGDNTLNGPVRQREFAVKNPLRPVPSYETVIWLASVLRGVRKDNNEWQKPDKSFLRAVNERHPKLMERISYLPFRKDVVQRILLQQNVRVYGSRYRYQNFTLGGPGVTTEASIINLLPPENVDWATRTLEARKDQDPDKIAENIAIAEQALGEIVRRPLWIEDRRRWETIDEANGRVQRTEVEYLELVEQMEHDIKTNPFKKAGDPMGDPSHPHEWRRVSEENPTSSVSESSLATELDEAVTLEAKANLTARHNAVKTRIRNKIALFSPLLPPKPIAPLLNHVDHSFWKAKSRRFPRVLELRQQGQPMKATRERADGGDMPERQSWLEQLRPRLNKERELLQAVQEPSATPSEMGVQPGYETSAFARIRDEEERLERESRAAQQALVQRKKEQAKRISGYLSATAGLDEVQLNWPSSFPLGPMTRTTAVPQVMAADPAIDDVPWDEAAGVPVKSKRGPKPAAEGSRKVRSVSIFGLDDSKDAVDIGNTGEARLDDAEAYVTTKKGATSRKQATEKLKQRSTALGGKGTHAEIEALRNADKKSDNRAAKKDGKNPDDDDEDAGGDDKPFGAWSKGGDGFIGF